MNGPEAQVPNNKVVVTRCYFCGGKTVLKRVTAENWWGNKLALVQDVPAWVCENCEETYFDAETSRQLDSLRQAPPEPSHTIEIPVYVFSDRHS